MFKWFRRSSKKRLGDDARHDLSRSAARKNRRRGGKTHHEGLPPDRSGGFDGNQDFVTRYGDPFDG